jgi:glycine hydroxymethyltransferase
MAFMGIRDLMKKEEKQQEETIDLIPSENIISRAVRNALGSVFVNKYAEGYPERRYYPGNAVVDDLERSVQDLARKVFRLNATRWHVNVQPYSGSPANVAIYMGLCGFGDAILGLSLTHGGHLTHGHEVSFSGRAYRAFHYGVGRDGRIDYEGLAKLARQHRPKVVISGATAYPRTIDFRRIGTIAHRVKAYHLADISHIAGLVAAGLHPSPFPYADVVMTTTHKTLRGPRGAMIFARPKLAEAIDRAVFPGLQGGPHLHTIAAIGVALEEALRPSFRRYAAAVVRNARALAEALEDEGFTLLTGGTDTHLLVIDLRPLRIGGREAERRLEEAGIIANRNTIPGDTSAFSPSGIRMGTPSVTSRGMGVGEMRQIARWVRELLLDERPSAAVYREVRRLCKKFPIQR